MPNHPASFASNSNPLENRFRVLFLGHGFAAFSLLKGLLATPHCDVVGVFRWTQRQCKGPSWPMTPDDIMFGQLIQQHRLYTLQCPGANSFQFIETLNRLKPHCILMGTWGEILKPHLIHLSVPSGNALTDNTFHLINCHPALLPAYRGPNPYSATICQGEIETGVTFHRVTEQVDAGAILLQQAVPIMPTDTAHHLLVRCGETAEAMVPTLIAKLRGQEPLAERSQMEESLAAKASYFPALTPTEGQIDWTCAPQRICNQVRGLQPWMASTSFIPNPFGGKTLVVVEKICMVPRSDLPQALTILKDALPGTILGSTSQGVWIVSCQDDVVFCMEKFRLYYFGLLPVWLSRWLGHFLFQRGKVLSAVEPS